MSEENVEVVRRFFDVMNRRDWRGLSAICSPEVEWHTPPGGLSERILTGVGAIQRWWSTVVSEAWADDSEDQIEEVLDLGDLIVVGFTSRDVGRGSGVPVESRGGAIFEFEQTIIVRMRFYLAHEQALEAAGLSE